MEIVQELTSRPICCHTVSRSKGESSFHWHENFEICAVINKPCRFRIDGIIYQANSGDIVTIPEQTVHQFLIDDNDTKVQIFQFHPKLLIGTSNRILPLAPHISKEELDSVDGLYESVTVLLNLLEQDEIKGHDSNNPYMRSLAASVYFLLQRYFEKGGTSLDGNKQRNDFYSIVEYINSHYTEDITVNSVSDHFYISRGKLASIFKKYSGTTVCDYIHSLRIRNANTLLSQGSTVTQAALSSGFESIRTFNNIYKKIMGMTPRDYLKNN